jgi:hypothetical protein
MSDEMICVARFVTRQEAELARGALEANSIQAVVAADDAGGEIPGLDFTTGVGVFVRQTDVEAAREILQPGD